jgi:protein SCO1/2
MISLMCTLALVLLLAGAPSASRLAGIRTAPHINHASATAGKVSLHQFRGKAVFVSFVFTTCSGSCPATTHRMAKVQEAVARSPDLKDKVQFISITLDPERDTPERLRAYMELYDITAPNWCFLTAAKDVVNKTLTAWGMWARPAANGQLDHPSRVFLVDPHGRIREIYNLDFLRTPWAVEDARLVLGEKE